MEEGKKESPEVRAPGSTDKTTESLTNNTGSFSQPETSVNGDSQGTAKHTKKSIGSLLRSSPYAQRRLDEAENLDTIAEERDLDWPETSSQAYIAAAKQLAGTCNPASLRPPVNGKAHTTAVLTRLHEVIPEKVRWVWRDRIPLAKLTLLDGDPGLGKSCIALDVGARVSTLTLMPDGTKGDLSEPSGVVLLSAEDDPADTIRPRLDAAGADCTKIVLLKGVQEKEHEHLPTLRDIAAIREAVAAVSAKLVVIDPLMAYLPGKTDSHRDQDVRSALAPLSMLAAETGAAILIVRHLNKTESGNVLYRGGGSIGIIGAARGGLIVAKDPENEEQRVLAAMKSNVAKLAPSLSYSIEAIDDVPRIKWGAASTHTAASLLAQQTDSSEVRSALGDAQEFLRALLGQGAREATAVFTEARSAGIAEKTLYRAKTALRIRAQKEGQPGSESQRWMWVLPPKVQTSSEDGQPPPEDGQPPPEDGQPPPEDGHTLTHGHLRASTEKNLRNDANLPEDGQGSECGHLRSVHGHLRSDGQVRESPDSEQGENQGPLAGAEVFE